MGIKFACDSLRNIGGSTLAIMHGGASEVSSTISAGKLTVLMQIKTWKKINVLPKVEF